MSDIENPSAYPIPLCNEPGAYPTEPGMTLRDYFAGQVLAGRMARMSAYASWEDAALDAYECADAMLKARKDMPLV